MVSRFLILAHVVTVLSASVAIFVEKLLIGRGVPLALALLLSLLGALISTMLIFLLVSNSSFLLKLYWGSLYLNGYWCYIYTLVGSDPENPTGNKKYFGVWRFDQNLFATKLKGFGLTNDFEPRSHVESVSNMFRNDGRYELLNRRSDSLDPERNFYSKTSMDLDNATRGFLNIPNQFDSQTVIFGGILMGNIHEDHFIKLEKSRNEEEAIRELKALLTKAPNSIDILSKEV